MLPSAAMDIHAPEGPTRSFRDFAIHIVIVTIGILIALGLEGLRETIHERHQLRETRELLQRELEVNQQQLGYERARTQESLGKLDDILQNYEALDRTPGELQARIKAIQPASWFLISLTWETALSTGVLGHMSPAEVVRDAGESIAVKTYITYQAIAVQQWEHTEAFFGARRVLTVAETSEGRERLELLRSEYRDLAHLQGELEEALRKARL